MLADLLHGDRAPGNIETRISGFPAMIPKIEPCYLRAEDSPWYCWQSSQ